ncbi:MAG: nucleotidyltransferase domain-containing protein [Thermofilaceae archaeon]
MLSEKLLVSEAKRRARIFSDLDKYLKTIADTVKRLDERGEAYLFGSVAEGEYLLSSDIDVLVVTDAAPAQVIAELWKNGITDPFEIHVVTRNVFEIYRKRAKLVRIA